MGVKRPECVSTSAIVGRMGQSLGHGKAIQGNRSVQVRHRLIFNIIIKFYFDGNAFFYIDNK